MTENEREGDPRAIVQSFFRGTGIFAERAELKGMAASLIPSLFEDYFDVLPANARHSIAEELCAAAAGLRENLMESRLEALQLIFALCYEKHWSTFRRCAPMIEEALKRSTAGDWHLPLALWGILALIGSPRVDALERELRATVRNAELWEALDRTRRVVGERHSARRSVSKPK